MSESHTKDCSVYDGDGGCSCGADRRNRLASHGDGPVGQAISADPCRTQFDLVGHLYRQRAFSQRVFGPGLRTAGVLDHIRKELKEIEASPYDLMEWVDVVLLALDGAWRAGHEPGTIARAISDKQAKNENRTWPDWRTEDLTKAIEHDRTGERAAPNVWKVEVGSIVRLRSGGPPMTVLNRVAVELPTWNCAWITVAGNTAGYCSTSNFPEVCLIVEPPTAKPPPGRFLP